MSLARRIALLAGFGVLLAIALSLGLTAWRNHQTRLPPGITVSNGRIEAVQVDVAPKYPGRLQAVVVKEGDLVTPGQVLAQLDTSELEASLAGARAKLAVAEAAVAEAASALTMRESALRLAEQELARAIPLAERGSLSTREAEQHQNARDSAQAALDGARARHRAAEREVDAANASIRQIEAQLAEYTLKSTVNGRVLYRLVENGEVVGAGGNVLTLLDLDDIYMEVFLPARVATRLAIGAEARLVLDALPEYVIPAKVSFVSPEAQFTPKQVETLSEREKLMFRVKVSIPQEIVAPHTAKVKTGVRGVAYVRFDDAVEWPADLTPHLPDGSP
ncbi:MAG: HlyD family secretion protein [Phycisphaerales bacterium JB059]